MALDLITITQDNLSWAVNENLKRIYAELEYKVPLEGSVRLQGDWDFQNAYTIRGVVAIIPKSVIPWADTPGHSILRIVTEEGYAMKSESGDHIIAEASGA